MPVVRAALFTVLLLTAVVLQTAFFPYFALDGATPNVVLLIVVAGALTRGPEFAAVLWLEALFRVWQQPARLPRLMRSLRVLPLLASGNY